MGKVESLQNPLRLPWLICIILFIGLIASIFACHYFADSIRMPIDESDRIFVRTALYALAIILFPLTNLMRHILLRLNQTMPGEKSANERYWLTILITQSMIESIGLFGPLMVVLGDDFNTLYIFSLMSALGIYLHRPKWQDYASIVDALSSVQH